MWLTRNLYISVVAVDRTVMDKEDVASANVLFFDIVGKSGSRQTKRHSARLSFWYFYKKCTVMSWWVSW